MKAGDLVRSVPNGILIQSKRVGLVVDTVQKKCWRTHVQGKKINWREIEPELHAVVWFPDNATAIEIPVVDLEVVR